MKRYKYIGSQEEANQYEINIPIVGKVYSEDDYIGNNNTTVEEWCSFPAIKREWEVEDLFEKTFGTSSTKDNINPDHYKQGKVECIDALEAATVNKTGLEAVCTSNIIKYLWRYESKNGVEDCKKAKWYLEKLISHLENKENA